MDAQTTSADATSARELQDATYAALNCRAVTEEAGKLTTSLCEQITATELRLGKRQHMRGVTRLRSSERLSKASSPTSCGLRPAVKAGSIGRSAPRASRVSLLAIARSRLWRKRSSALVWSRRGRVFRTQSNGNRAVPRSATGALQRASEPLKHCSTSAPSTE